MLVHDNAQAFAYEEKVSSQATDEVAISTASVILSEAKNPYSPKPLRAVFYFFYFFIFASCL